MYSNHLVFDYVPKYFVHVLVEFFLEQLIQLVHYRMNEQVHRIHYNDRVKEFLELYKRNIKKINKYESELRLGNCCSIQYRSYFNGSRPNFSRIVFSTHAVRSSFLI